jgi:hypothetical protein
MPVKRIEGGGAVPPAAKGRAWLSTKYLAPLAAGLFACSVVFLCSSCGKADRKEISETRPRVDVPTYNAQLVPQLPRSAGEPSRPIIQSGQSVELLFGIGPRWPSSDLPVVVPDPRIVQAETDIPLTATLFCSFCEPHGAFLRDLVYRPSERQSNVVSFTMTPQRAGAVSPAGYAGKLALAIYDDRNGQAYDRLEFEVLVVDRPTSSAAVPVTPDSAVRAPWMPTDPGDAAADVKLHIVQDSELGITVKVVPIAPALRTALGARVLAGDGRFRHFRTGARDRRQLEAYTGDAYTELSAISFQGALARQLRRRGSMPISENSRKTLTLTERESAFVTKTLAGIGKDLYRLLFVDGTDGAQLAEVIGLIEQFASDPQLTRPVRMLIASDQLSLPWQYLHPMGHEVDATRFWGLRFSLAVQRAGNHHLRTQSLLRETNGKVVFARYAGVSDPTVPLANEQIGQLERLLGTKPLVVDSATRFVEQALGAERTNVTAIFAFLHAASGRSLQAGSGQVLVQQDARGPLLLFSEDDYLTTHVLRAPINEQPVAVRLANPVHLQRRPLVVLNACETGPSTFSVPHVTLEEQFFQLGAQGIVVTEVSVWVALGHAMAMQLNERLANGEAAADALTAVRRALYQEKRNPLGLLYAYYGDPQAALKR